MNITRSIENRVKSALSVFQKTKNELEKINKDISSVSENKQKQIKELEEELRIVKVFYDDNSKVISKINNLLS